MSRLTILVDAAWCAMTQDVQARQGWIVDQAQGIEAVSSNIARAGFESVFVGTP